MGSPYRWSWSAGAFAGRIGAPSFCDVGQNCGNRCGEAPGSTARVPLIVACLVGVGFARTTMFVVEYTEERTTSRETSGRLGKLPPSGQRMALRPKPKVLVQCERLLPVPPRRGAGQAQAHGVIAGCRFGNSANARRRRRRAAADPADDPAADVDPAADDSSASAPMGRPVSAAVPTPWVGIEADATHGRSLERPSNSGRAHELVPLDSSRGGRGASAADDDAADAAAAAAAAPAAWRQRAIARARPAAAGPARPTAGGRGSGGGGGGGARGGRGSSGRGRGRRGGGGGGGARRPARRRRTTRRVRPFSADSGRRGDRLCYICYDAQVDSARQPCGHTGLCYDCSIATYARLQPCPTCRADIDQIVTYENPGYPSPSGKMLFRVTGPEPEKELIDESG